MVRFEKCEESNEFKSVASIVLEEGRMYLGYLKFEVALNIYSGFALGIGQRMIGCRGE